MLRPLGELVDIWCDTHSVERSDKEKYSAVAKLKELVDAEKRQIVAVLVKLPGNNVLNKALGIPKSEWYGSLRGKSPVPHEDDDDDDDDNKAEDAKPYVARQVTNRLVGSHGTLLRNQAHAVFESRHNALEKRDFDRNDRKHDE